MTTHTHTGRGAAAYTTEQSNFKLRAARTRGWGRFPDGFRQETAPSSRRYLVEWFGDFEETAGKTNATSVERASLQLQVMEF